ncbi:MAG: superoxide dismutase [Chitinispirillaceae bacterium]|nr:superoxide dismutase [Chitinispirillaceae bacterium]
MNEPGKNVLKDLPPFKLPPLPYAQDALQPVISSSTISFHYLKHHQKYINTTNEIISGTAFEKSTLEQIIKSTAQESQYQKLYNNAGQTFNHWFYWNSMKPSGGGIPQGATGAAITRSFGSFDSFAKELFNTSSKLFGSGWTWLVKDNSGSLKIINTANGDTPLTMGLTPLITIDLWEHAYYLDYQNKRDEYALSVINKCLNWEFADINFGG